jgi:alpha-L-glutamate ligase-like protein
VFDHICYQGVPDVRIIIFLGVPVMAMLRLPTRTSGGKANLHQGAIGVGIDLASGATLKGVSRQEIVGEHPDTGHSLQGLVIPHWETLLDIAARCHELAGLGYLGVDLVLDQDRGPLLLKSLFKFFLTFFNLLLIKSSPLKARFALCRSQVSPSVFFHQFRSWQAINSFQ